MPKARVDRLDLCYDTFGDASGECVLLVNGQGGQMISWDAAFCDLLAGQGLYVVRFDNRDVGLSTCLDDLGVPDLAAVLAGGAVPYTIDDMADDAVGLLDAIGVAAAHVVGRSMGGFIAQSMAIRHRPRVLSLTSVMSGAGGDALTPPTDDAMARMLADPPTDRDEYIRRSLDDDRRMHPGFEVDEDAARTRAGARWDRGIHPDGSARHLAACVHAPSRVDALRALDVPALVVHGDADDILPLANAYTTARAIPGAELLVVEGMGHDLPPQVFERVAGAIAELAQRRAPRPSR